MKSFLFSFFIIVLFSYLFSGCTVPADQKSESSRLNLETTRNLTNDPYMNYPAGQFSDGNYYVKNRWTGEYLNLQNNDGILERGYGPLDATYLWHLNSNQMSTTMFLNSAKNLGISAGNWYWIANQNWERLGVYRWSDDPCIVNSTFPTGPYTITGGMPVDSYVLSCENLISQDGLNLIEMISFPVQGWWSKDWYIIPGSRRIILDRFFNNAKNELGYDRYIYQCMGSQAFPSDPAGILYDTRPTDNRIWDGNYVCGKFGYNNVIGGISGLGINLSYNGSHSADLTPAVGIRFWARTDFDYNNPRAQVQINSTFIGNYGWLGNYWHYGFLLTQKWQRFEIPFSNFNSPVYDGTSLDTCLRQVKSIEFQQDSAENAAGYNLSGNIYIDSVELYY
jgi:hypothetical protein